MHRRSRAPRWPTSPPEPKPAPLGAGAGPWQAGVGRHGAAAGADESNRSAAWLAGLILLALGLDAVLNGGRGAFFLALRFADLLNWVAFWR